METKSEAVRLVSELFERAENQANTIDSQKDRLTELNGQLEDKYSTETHLLVSRETLDRLIEKFEELGSEFSNLEGLLDDINSYASSINDDSGYNDAGSYKDYAREYADEVRDLLSTETEEIE